MTPDFKSTTWLYLEKWLNEQIAELRMQNDVPTLDDRATTAIRAEIAAYKKLALLPETMRRGDTRREQTRLLAGGEY